MTNSWELSPLYRHAQTVTTPFSGSHLVTSHLNRIILRRTQDLQIERTWALPIDVPVQRPLRENNNAASSLAASTSRPANKTATETSPLTSLSVSPAEPHFVLAYSAKERAAWVLDPAEGEPVARFDVGAEGALAMTWSETGDTIIAWSALHLRLSLYRLSAPSQPLHIHNPKLAYPHGFSFRSVDARYLAVAERHSSRDYVGIYDCQSWRLLRHFALPSHTSDVADIAWSPCGRFIAVWEHLTDYIMHIYTPDGRLLKTFQPYSTFARALPAPAPTRPSAKDSTVPTSDRVAGQDKERARLERSTDGWVGLGIKTVQWHPTGGFLAIGGWDGKIRVLTRLSWAPVAELSHPAKVSAPVCVWTEPKEWVEKTRGKGIVPFDATSQPFIPVSVRPDLGRANPRMGVSSMAWSPSGRWLASYNQTFPDTVWLFSFLSLPSPTGSSPQFRPQLHSVMSHNVPVKSFAWQPTSADAATETELLVIATAQKGFTMFRAPAVEGEAGVAECVGVPSRAPFEPSKVNFTAAGDALLLSDKASFAVAYPVTDEHDEASVLERSYVAAGEDQRQYLAVPY